MSYYYLFKKKKNDAYVSELWLTWSKNTGSFCIQPRGDSTKRNMWKSETPLRQQSWVSWPRHRCWCCERLLFNDNCYVPYRRDEVEYSTMHKIFKHKKINVSVFVWRWIRDTFPRPTAILYFNIVYCNRTIWVGHELKFKIKSLSIFFFVFF